VADAFGFNGIDPDANGTFTNGDEQLNVSPSGDWGYSRLSFDTGVSSGIAVACPTNADCPEPATTIPQHPADLPSQEDAKATALALLQRAGIDTEHATVTVDDFVTQWSVRVDPIVDGVPTEGLGSTVTIGEKSVIEYANGITGQPQTAAEYPLIGTSAAIDRLNKGEGYIGPRPMRAQAATDTASGGASAGGSTGSAGVAVDAPPTPASPTPTKPGPLGTIPPCDGSSAATDGNAAGDAGSAPTVTCSPIDEQPPATIAPPPPQEITITGAERVLLFAPSFTGDIGFLVPAYRFTTSDGFGPTVLAIDDSFLQPPVDQVPTGKESIGSVGPGEPPAGVEPQPAPASDPPMTIEPGK
jgi:hypothetical protein